MLVNDCIVLEAVTLLLLPSAATNQQPASTGHQGSALVAGW